MVSPQLGHRDAAGRLMASWARRRLRRAFEVRRFGLAMVYFLLNQLGLDESSVQFQILESLPPRVDVLPFAARRILVAVGTAVWAQARTIGLAKTIH